MFILPSKEPFLALLGTQTPVQRQDAWSSVGVCKDATLNHITSPASVLASSLSQGQLCLMNTAFGEGFSCYPFSCVVQVPASYGETGVPCFTNRPALLVTQMQLRLDDDLAVWGKEEEAEHIFSLGSTF